MAEWPRSPPDVLALLHLREGLRELRVSISKTTDAAAHISGSSPGSELSSVPIEEIADIDLFPLSVQETKQVLHMLLKDVEIADPGLHKLRAEQLPRFCPFLSVCGKYPMPKELLPIAQKICTFALSV
ncbi:MAG: hypothetical protein L6R35_002563 [Caloplaca aegaea]|nr:MAG: hypothetical protein L6R35_002563 [Caloplaca aegaea]